MAKIDDVMQEFASNVDEIVMSTIVSLEDGTPLTGFTTDESLDITVPVAFLADVMRRGIMAADNAALGKCEDLLLTTSEYFAIMRVIPETNYSHIVVLTKKGNWGVTKVLMAKFAPRFKEVLP